MSGTMSGPPDPRPQPGRGKAPPLDPDSLSALAVRYLERYQTSRARLVRYLEAKLRQRGWAGASPPDAAALADRLVARGYVDDAAFAAARTRSLARRGYGEARVLADLAAAGVDSGTRSAALADLDAFAAAREFARRRRLGPFGPQPLDPAARARQMAKLLRAGHGLRHARAILAATREAELRDPADD